jgi:hypothetical protein
MTPKTENWCSVEINIYLNYAWSIYHLST